MTQITNAKVKIFPDYKIENSYENLIVVGIDEAGRGPIAGPVVAACAFLNADFLQDKICGEINDSKKISAKKRRDIFLHLKQKIKYGIGVVDEKIIDEINILEASKLAMLKAYEDFCKNNKMAPQVLLVDGNFKPFALRDKISAIVPIVKGDQKSLSIAAASILAKETRDEIMLNLHQKYQQFAWDKNAGYPTKLHLEALEKFGICEFHRRSFAPVKKILAGI